MVQPPVFAQQHPLVRIITTIASDTLPEIMSFSFQHASSCDGDLFSFIFSALSINSLLLIIIIAGFHLMQRHPRRLGASRACRQTEKRLLITPSM
jgi:hypothetical protein